MILLLILLFFRGLTAAPIGESEAKDGLVFPTRPPTTTTIAPTTTVDWKETLVVDETDGKNEKSYGFWTSFLDHLSRNYEQDDLIWAEFNTSDFEELKQRYLASSQYKKIGKPEGLTEDLLSSVVNEKFLHRKLLESVERMEEMATEKGSLIGEGHNSEHRYAIAAHSREQCRYGIALDHLELIKDERGKLPRKIHLDPEDLGKEHRFMMEAHIFRPDYDNGKKWPKEDVQTEYEWTKIVLGRDDARPNETKAIKESIRALSTLRGARHLNISCEDIDSDNALDKFLCNEGDYRNFVERDLNMTELGKIDWGFRINLYRIISDILPLSEKSHNGRICGQYHLWPKVVESRTQLGLGEPLDSVYSVDRSWTRTYDRALEFTSEQPPFCPFRVGRSDIFMKRIRKVEVNPHYYAELDDATVAKRRKLDCELGRNRRGFIARVWNWIKSLFVSEEEC